MVFAWPGIWYQHQCDHRMTPTVSKRSSGGWKHGYISCGWACTPDGRERTGIADLPRNGKADARRWRPHGLCRHGKIQHGALRFFKRMGFAKPVAEVWMSKLIQRPRKQERRKIYPSLRCNGRVRRTGLIAKRLHGRRHTAAQRLRV